jgi:hypothetical protein
MSLIDAIKKERQLFTPKTGYTLVGLDCFELPGEQMYLIAHYDKRKDAEKAQEQHPDTIILSQETT